MTCQAFRFFGVFYIYTTACVHPKKSATRNILCRAWHSALRLFGWWKVVAVEAIAKFFVGAIATENATRVCMLGIVLGETLRRGGSFERWGSLPSYLEGVVRA